VVTQELRRGYRLRGKVLRAALVIVDVDDETRS
jgi:molecular chaperone GrpE (heat shock protein)